jgi:hypothetical protein
MPTTRETAKTFVAREDYADKVTSALDQSRKRNRRRCLSHHPSARDLPPRPSGPGMARRERLCGISSGASVHRTSTVGTTMKRATQSQASLEDQLDKLETLARDHGLYDAQDWLRVTRALARKRPHVRTVGPGAWWYDTAKSHNFADAACGRAWTCSCGACRAAREEGMRSSDFNP